MICADATLAVLAAGRSTRFGSNKLEALVDGQMLGAIAAEALAGLGWKRRIAIVAPGSAALAANLGALGYDCIINASPEEGLSRSVALAAQAAEGLALVVALADTPLVTSDHIEALLAKAGSEAVTASKAGPQPTPPAVFPKQFWPQLATLQGDQGARGLLRDAHTVEAPVGLLNDVDTPADLAAFLQNRAR
jgi:molybdenum cofactor cytidylyltransferase